MSYDFYSSCVDWPTGDVNTEGGLSDLINDRIEITRRTFLKHTDYRQVRWLAMGCGYAQHPSQGLTMAGDAYIEYFRSKLHGKRVYGFRWSSIEYVFVKQEEAQP